MKLVSYYVPVADLKPALAFYRDALGWDETWREGELTVGLQMPGTDVELMLDQDPSDPRPSPFFQVDDVRAFYTEKSGTLRFVAEPIEIPPGWTAAFEDPAGNLIRILDTTKEGAADA